MKKGVFYGVSVGPGDPELLTVKAVRVLENCAVIAVPRTRSGETLALDIVRQAVALEGKTVLPLFFPMGRDKDEWYEAHARAAAEIGKHLDAGRDVAMPNLGDVSIYSTCSYLMEPLRQAGYETVMIPGVPSFCAAAARVGNALVSGNAPLHVIPAGAEPLEPLLETPGAKVLMKSGRSFSQTVETLRAAGLLEQAVLVENCGLPEERVCTDLCQVPERVGYFATILVREE